MRKFVMRKEVGKFRSLAYAHLLHLFHVVVVLTKQCSCHWDARNLSGGKIISLCSLSKFFTFVNIVFKNIIDWYKLPDKGLNSINMHAIVPISFWDWKDKCIITYK